MKLRAMSIFLTIFSGVFVFVIGQLLVKLLIEPIHGYKVVVGEISIALINLAKDYANPGVGTPESMDKAQDTLRLLASKLSASVTLIPAYEFWRKPFFLPNREEIHDAKSQLIGLSNSIHQRDKEFRKVSTGEQNMRRAEKICKILGIYIPKNERLYEDNSGSA
jgi:hypothetical protein